MNVFSSRGPQRLIALHIMLVLVALEILQSWLAPATLYAQPPARESQAERSLHPIDTAEATATGMAVRAVDNAPHVQVTFSGVISGSVLAYTIVAVNPDAAPVWDLSLTIPMPDGAEVLMTDADDMVFVDVAGHEISFYRENLDAGERTGPHRIWISTEAIDDIYISTEVGAKWKHVLTADRQSSLVEDSSASTPVTVVNGRYQVAVADNIEAVPLGYIDLTRVDLYREISNLRADIHVASPIGPVGEPAEYALSIDADCSAETGRTRRGLGIDFRVRYRHNSGRADVSEWTVDANGSGKWQLLGSISALSSPSSQLLSMWIPIQLLNGTEQFCWLAESRRSAVPGIYQALEDQLPADDADPMLTRFGASPSISAIMGDVASSAGEPLRPDQ